MHQMAPDLSGTYNIILYTRLYTRFAVLIFRRAFVVFKQRELTNTDKEYRSLQSLP